MGSKGRALVAELFRFHLVGAGTVLIGTLTFLGLVTLGTGYGLALLGDYALGIAFSYFMNKEFTFRAKVEKHARPLSATVLSYALTFLLNLLLLTLAVEILRIGVVPAQIVIMLLLAALNFLLFKFLIFGKLARPKLAVRAAARQDT